MANLTIGDIYIAVNKVLENYETQIEGKPTLRTTEIRVITDERFEAKESIEAELKKLGITPGPPTGGKAKSSSFEGSEIGPFGNDKEKIRFVYKNRTNKGSGGGAELTRLTESAQCVYAAIAFGLGRAITQSDITEENLKKFKDAYDIDGDMDKIKNDMPPVWRESCVLGANLLEKEFNKGGKKYVFHRGGSEVKKIEDEFKRTRQKEGLRMDVNKWNPADIWMIASDFHWGCLKDENTLVGYTHCISENLDHGTLMGISLKKITGTAKITVMNKDRAKEGRCKDYKGYKFSPDSIDGYLVLSGGTEIQYRSFGGPNDLTGFQGELKGTKANQGKISLGPTNVILKAHKQATVPTNAASLVKSDISGVAEIVRKGYEKYAKQADASKIIMNKLKEKDNRFFYSKYQVVKLLDIMTNIKDKEVASQIVEDLYLYAASRSKYSSKYYKLE